MNNFKDNANNSLLNRLTNGWILVNKPCGMSSNDVVQKVKRYLKNAIRQYANDYLSRPLSDSLSDSKNSKLQSILSEKSDRGLDGISDETFYTIFHSDNSRKNEDKYSPKQFQCIKNPSGQSLEQLSEKILSEQFFRKAIKYLKVGHCGTLDVEASGLLVIAVGEATKLVNSVHSFDKDYEFSLAWGVQTTTDDATGDVLYTNQKVPSIVELQSILNEFRGNISQIPPKFSAISIDGKRCYDVMRNGGDVNIKARDVNIYDLQFVARRDFSNLSDLSGQNEVSMGYDQNEIAGNLDVNRVIKSRAIQFDDFFVTCSTGTYVRSLCRDIAQRCGGHGHAFRIFRTRIGPFSIKDAMNVDEFVKISKKI